MKKYIVPKQNKVIKSKTMFTEDECGERVIRTEFTETIKVSETDPNADGLELGKAQRGSMKVIRTATGYGLLLRRFRQSETTTAAEPLTRTEHGRITQNGRHTRIVFEFSRRTPFGDISDALDDEIWEMRQYLSKEGGLC